MLSTCNIYLFPVLVLRSGFAFLTAPVHVHCFYITFKTDNRHKRKVVATLATLILIVFASFLLLTMTCLNA